MNPGTAIDLVVSDGPPDEVIPDVVGLQELKTPDADFPYDFFKDLGYEALVHGQKSWNGVAILHKPELSAELVQAGLTG